MCFKERRVSLNILDKKAALGRASSATGMVSFLRSVSPEDSVSSEDVPEKSTFKPCQTPVIPEDEEDEAYGTGDKETGVDDQEEIDDLCLCEFKEDDLPPQIGRPVAKQSSPVEQQSLSAEQQYLLKQRAFFSRPGSRPLFVTQSQDFKTIDMKVDSERLV